MGGRRRPKKGGGGGQCAVGMMMNVSRHYRAMLPRDITVAQRFVPGVP